MTDNYAKLAAKEPIFAELQNLMDLCVVAALIEREGLREKASCELPLLYDSESKLLIDTWNPPKTVASECSVMKAGKRWIITVSGGVQIQAWQAASKSELVPAIDVQRKDALRVRATDRWWN